MTRYEPPSGEHAGSHWYLFAAVNEGRTYLFSTRAGHRFVGTIDEALANGTLRVVHEDGRTSYVNPKAIADLEDEMDGEPLNPLSTDLPP